MGLDMYLYKKSYVLSGEWYKPEDREEIKMTRGGKEVDASKIKYILEEVAYWRKANAIHRWFVENVQNGVDNCAEYIVSADQLLELRDLCQRVLDNPEDTDSLPTTSGFFFGSADYDEYYRQDIENTIKAIDDLNLSDEESRYSTYIYTSSW